MSDVEPDGDGDDATAATWLGRHTVSETRGFTTEGQTSNNQATNASAYFSELGAGAGSTEAHAASNDKVNFAHASSHPPGSWSPRPAAWTS